MSENKTLARRGGRGLERRIEARGVDLLDEMGATQHYVAGCQRLGLSDPQDYSTSRIASLRERAAEIAKGILEAGPQGSRSLPGSIDPFNVERVVDAFPCLHLKPGWGILANVYSDFLGSQAAVSSRQPTGSDASSGGETARIEEFLRRLLGRDPHYAGQQADSGPIGFMEAVEGDRSKWAYLSASLLARELLDFGVFWHGCYQHDWHDLKVIDRWPPEEVVSAEAASQDKTAIRLQADALACWQPRVVSLPSQTIVRFVTYRHADLHWEAVFEHCDRYAPGSLVPFMTRSVVALGNPPSIIL